MSLFSRVNIFAEVLAYKRELKRERLMLKSEKNILGSGSIKKSGIEMKVMT